MKELFEDIERMDERVPTSTIHVLHKEAHLNREQAKAAGNEVSKALYDGIARGLEKAIYIINRT